MKGSFTLKIFRRKIHWEKFRVEDYNFGGEF